jgi:hypothetical protein
VPYQQAIFLALFLMSTATPNTIEPMKANKQAQTRNGARA